MNKKEKPNIISLHKKVALGLSIITMLSTATPVFAFTPANSETKQAIKQKIEEIQRNQEIQKHLLGTDYLAPPHNTNYTPGIDLGDYEDVDDSGKLYSKDSYILTADQISETAWYAIYDELAKAKNNVDSLDQDGANALLAELNRILDLYSVNNDQKLKEDGDYEGSKNFKIVEVRQDYTDGNTSVYKKTGKEIQEIKDIFSEMQIVKWGNELDLLFVSKNKINSLVLRKVSGKDIWASIGSSAPKNLKKNDLVAIPIPAELNGEQLVVESMSYVDSEGETKKVGPFGIDIDYAAMGKTTLTDNSDRFSKKTKARIKYWIKRGEILIGKYLDADVDKDKERIAKVTESIEKLNQLRNSDKPSMTKALEYAQPIYEIENAFTLMEVLNIKVAEAMEDISSKDVINEDKYTKESIENFKKFLENTEKEAGDLDAKELVDRINMVQGASQNRILKYNTSKLEKLVEKAKKYEESKCEQESYLAMKLALTKAEKWLEANKTYSPSYNETEEQYKKLDEAIKALKGKDGQPVPEISDDSKKSQSNAVYEVPVTSVSNDKVRPLLKNTAKYYEKENKIVLTFEKNNNFITDLTYYDAEFQQKKGDVISANGKHEGKDILREVALTNVFGKSTLSPAVYINVKYHDVDKMGDDELNAISVGLDLKNKKLISGEINKKDEKKEQTKPYEVPLDIKNQDGNEKTYLERLVEPRGIYDPVNKKLKLKVNPEMQDGKVKTYLTAIQYTGSKNAEVTKKESKEVVGQNTPQEIPMEFTINFDIEKDIDDNKNARLVLSTDAYDSSKTNKKGYDFSIYLFVKNENKKQSKEESESIDKTLNTRLDTLKENFNKVQTYLPDEIDVFDSVDKSVEWNQNNGENQKIKTKKVNIKSEIISALNQSDEIKTKATKEKEGFINKLEGYSLAIQPWVNFIDRLQDEVDNINEIKTSKRYTQESVDKVDGILLELAKKKQPTISQNDLKEYTAKLNELYSYLRLDPTALETKIKEAEEKINSGKYKDQGVKALKDTLYGYKQPDISYKPYYDKDTINYKGLSNSYGAKAFLADINDPKNTNKDENKGKDGVNLDILVYDTWIKRLDKAMEALEEKTAKDVTTRALEEKIEEAKKLKKNNTKSEEANTTIDAAIESAKKLLKSTKQDEIDNAVKTLEKAIEDYKNSNDVFKTDKLEKTIAKAKDILAKSNKEEKAKVDLNKAIETAKNALKANNQADINKADEALEKAIENFSQTPDKKDSDVNVEATKTATVELYHEKEEKLSMAKDVLWNKAKLTKENGKWYLQLQIVPMQNENPSTKKMETTGALTKLKYTLDGQEKFAQVLGKVPVKVGNNSFESPSFLRLEVKENQKDIPVQLFYLTFLSSEEYSPNARIRINWDSLVDGFNENEYKVDKGPLIELIKGYESLSSFTKNNKDLNETLKNNLVNEINKAKQVVANPSATRENIEKAYNDLVPVGEALRNAYEIKQTYITGAEANLREFEGETGKYTAESLNKYKEIIKQAKDALKEASDYKKISDAYNAIKSIDDVLVYDTSKLEEKIKESETKLNGNFTKDSIDALKIKISDARSWVDNAKRNGIKAGYKKEEHLKALEKAVAELKNIEAQESKEIKVSLKNKDNKPLEINPEIVVGKAISKKVNDKYYVEVSFKAVEKATGSRDVTKEYVQAVSSVKYKFNDELKDADVLSKEKVRVNNEEFNSPTKVRMQVNKDQQSVDLKLDVKTETGNKEADAILSFANTEENKKTYTVTFKTDHTDAPKAQAVEENGKLTKPTGFEKDITEVQGKDGKNYVFKGWFNGNDEFDFSKTITGSITLIAKWEAKEESKVLDKSALISKIEKAKEIKKGNKTAEAFNKLVSVIDDIETSLDSIKNKDALDKAIARLNAAIKEFNESDNEVELNKDALEQLIENAKAKLNDDKPQSEKDKLSASITIATNILNTATIQDVLNNALTSLQNAISAFDNYTPPVAKKVIYKVPVAFYSATNKGNPVAMGGDTLVPNAELLVEGDNAKLTITLIPSNSMQGKYVTKLYNNSTDKTPIGEVITTSVGEGLETRPEQYIINLKSIDLDRVYDIPAVMEAKDMPMPIGVDIHVNLDQKEVISQEEGQDQNTEVKKTELIKLVKSIENKDFASATEEAKKQLNDALTNASTVITNKAASEEDVTNAISKLNTAIENASKKKEPETPPTVKVNKDALKALIDSANGKKESDYTTDSFAKFKEALNKAKEVYNDINAKQDKVDEAKTNLENAINKFEENKVIPPAKKIDKTELDKVIKKANGISTSKYTSESVKNFEKALKVAKDLIKDSNATQEKVNEAKTNLENAISNLKENVNKIDLFNLIKESERIYERDFEDDVYLREFRAELRKAKAVYNDKNAIQNEVDKAVRDLSVAKSNLNAKKKGNRFYEVPVYAEKITGGESMANKVLTSYAKVEEKDGRFTYTVQFGKLTIGDKTAGVDTLYIYDGGTKYTASRGYNGTFSWTTNSKVYTQRVSFEVSAMSSAQDAILRFNWSGATVTKEDSRFNTPAPNKKVEMPKKSEDKKKEEEKKNNIINSNKADVNNFNDINGHWAKNAIDYVVSKGYFKGLSNTEFGPNKAITRGQFVTVLGRMLNVNTSEYSSQSFSDVNSNTYYSPYIAWASKMGIVNGVGNNKFAPDKELTREEMAVMMSKFLKIANKNLSVKGNVNFNDNNTIAPWAKDSVAEMAKLGVVKGMENGNFSPKTAFTRAQVAQVLYNIDHQ
ncbi:S-layer homology domain-containing protein [Peptoniphilus sp. MSJ-1]|uniref:S-layer homology domain-containing protein n=1 Tax=Peptoniphilus ovalis TaxID=2841503 RepID=A0ABS6FGY6_9FIRM|nr:S-layer homology domain-containing protein [Peptoniphilus ovalis]MBU5669440.1 S-layer homology domain-containing protein [Peptoniphilus ovalis]